MAELVAVEKGAAGAKLFEQRPETDEGALPQWFREGRAAAWEEFERLPMPGRRQENWRFANLARLDFSECRAAAPVEPAAAAELARRSRLLADVAGRLVFANDRLVAREAPATGGVTLLSFEEALASHADLLEKHFMLRQTRLGSEKFAAWHRAVMSNGVFLHVAEGVEVERPIEVHHWLCGRNVAVFPHTLVLAEPRSKVRLVNHLVSASAEDDGLSVGVADVVAGEDSSVWLFNCQNRSANSREIQMTTTAVYRDAAVKTLLLSLGSSWVRSELVTHLLETGAVSEMLAAAVLSGNQELDQRTLQHHEAPHTTSDLLFKNALFDHARSIFSGLIQVDEEAHYTDAFQKCRHLMGSDDAEANAMPGLEINADQVKCSHGATAGEVDENALFYLMSRGIDPATARQLITFGFTKEVVEHIGDEAIEAMVLRLVEEKFRALRF